MVTHLFMLAICSAVSNAHLASAYHQNIIAKLHIAFQNIQSLHYRNVFERYLTTARNSAGSQYNRVGLQTEYGVFVSFGLGKDPHAVFTAHFFIIND